jgi:hypothetical protein
MIPLTSELHDRYLREIIGIHDRVEIKDTLLLEITRTFNSPHWHVDGNLLWESHAWKQSEAKWTKMREASEVYNQMVYERKEALSTLLRNVRTKLGLSHEQAFMIAHKILKARSAQAAALFDVNIDELPELPVPHLVMTDKGEYYEL